MYWLQQLTEANLAQGGAPQQHAHDELTLSSPRQTQGDNLNSPANMHSPSTNLLSPNTAGLTSSASVDDGLRRRGTQDDVFGDLLQRPTNAPPPALPPLSPGQSS